MPEETNGSSKAASDIDTRTVTVTFFKNKAAATLRVEDVTLRQLADRIAGQSGADKARLPLLKLAKFGDKRTDRNCLRHDANVIEFGGIESEHDAGTMTFEAALETVQEARHPRVALHLSVLCPGGEGTLADPAAIVEELPAGEARGLRRMGQRPVRRCYRERELHAVAGVLLRPHWRLAIPHRNNRR